MAGSFYLLVKNALPPGQKAKQDAVALGTVDLPELLKHFGYALHFHLLEGDGNSSPLAFSSPRLINIIFNPFSHSDDPTFERRREVDPSVILPPGTQPLSNRELHRWLIYNLIGHRGDTKAYGNPEELARFLELNEYGKVLRAGAKAVNLPAGSWIEKRYAQPGEDPRYLREVEVADPRGRFDGEHLHTHGFHKEHQPLTRSPLRLLPVSLGLIKEALESIIGGATIERGEEIVYHQGKRRLGPMYQIA